MYMLVRVVLDEYTPGKYLQTPKVVRTAQHIFSCSTGTFRRSVSVPPEHVLPFRQNK